MLNNKKCCKAGLLRYMSVMVCGAMLLYMSTAAFGESVRIAKQYGVGYLPMIIMQHDHLIQKYAKNEGIDTVKVEWTTVGGGATATTALLAGSVDFAVVGVGPMLRLWDKTKELNGIHGVAALDSIPMLLNCVNPKVKKLADLSSNDRIAVPSVKNSFEAIALEMAAAQKWGKSQKYKLDNLTVSMKHPDAMAALLGGRAQIDCDFTTPPYYAEELQNSKVHTILNSYDVLGGKSTLLALVGPQSYNDQHPKMYKAVFEALRDADKYIREHPHKAAKIYIEQTNSHLPQSLIDQVIEDPRIEFAIAPRNVLKVARFMHELGMVKHMPVSWKDVFFKNVHNENGS